MPTLFDIKNQFGEKGDLAIKAILVKEIGSLLRYINVGKTMDEDQIAETADLIQIRYSNMNLADYKLFFQKFKFGDYGTLFDRIDGMVILGALDKYKNSRMDSAEHLSIKQAAEFKLLEKEPINLESSQDYIDAIKAILSSDKPKVNNLYQKGKIVEQREEKPRNLAIDQVWMRQFNNLARGNKFRRYQVESPIRMIQVGDLKPMSITEYLEYKIKSIK